MPRTAPDVYTTRLKGWVKNKKARLLEEAGFFAQVLK